MLKKPKTISQLKKDADKFFSLATRYRFAEKQGNEWYAECCTCGVRKNIKELQCGHFMSRRFNSVRYNEMNTAPQCVACNMFRGGEQFKFSQFIEDYYGVGTAKELQWAAPLAHKLTKEELNQIIQDSKEYIKDCVNN